MNEQDQVAAPAEGGDQPASPTLEQVYADHKIEDDAQRFKADEFKPVQPVITGDNGEVYKTLNDVTQAVNELRAERQQTSIKSDIASAVSAVEKETGLSPRLIETHLDLLARDDHRFRQIWINRHVRPQVLQAALKAASAEMMMTYQVRADPDLLANQKAMRTYQSGSSTRQAPSEGGWDNLSQADFSKKWSSIVNS